MRIFIVSKATWNIPAILVDQTVADIIASGFHASITDIVVVADGFRVNLPPGATLMGTQEAETLLLNSENACIVHFGILLKGSESFTQYFIDLTNPKHLADGWMANILAQSAHKKNSEAV